MKRNEIALLVLIVGVVALAAYFTVKSIIGGGDPKAITIDKAESISSTLAEPAKNIFNENAYNPTIKIKIGDQSNQGPF